MKIKRRDTLNGRWYPITESIWYKSYTTVLSMMPTSPFFIKWLKTHTAEESEQLLSDAGLQGSKIHHTIDLILKGETLMPSGWTEEQVEAAQLHEDDLISYLKKPFSEKEDSMIKGFKNFLIDYKIKTIKTEFTVWDDDIKCAGTMDWYGEICITEKLTITKKKKLDLEAAMKGQAFYKLKSRKYYAVIDWKTGKGIYESHYRQVAGYFTALRKMIKKKLVDLKNPTKAFLLHLGTGKYGDKYNLIEIDDINVQYKRFKRVNEEWEDAHPGAIPERDYEFMDEYSLKSFLNN